LKKKYDFRRIRIERDYDEAWQSVPCVATEIEQVMLNLLRNAAQAMTENEKRPAPTIVLKLFRENDMAVIEVQDNGPGYGRTGYQTGIRAFLPPRTSGSAPAWVCRFPISS
jgi:two-component system, NtrC family, sensor kinase